MTSSRGAVAATAIAEYALAAAAHFARGLHEAARQKAAGQFTRDGYQTRTLGGATMGVIGLGGIGREVARLSRAAGMRVIGTRRSVTAPLPGADGADLVLPAGRILQVAAESDFLVVCSQLTAETRGLISAAVFAAMKPGAVLINVARGEEVDEDALVEAVTAGRIRGAVLDVYAGELRQAAAPGTHRTTPDTADTAHLGQRRHEHGRAPAAAVRREPPALPGRPAPPQRRRPRPRVLAACPCPGQACLPSAYLTVAEACHELEQSSSRRHWPGADADSGRAPAALPGADRTGVRLTDGFP